MRVILGGLVLIAFAAGAAMAQTRPAFARIVQTRFSVKVAKNSAGRWRVDYASLTAAPPEIFR